MDIQICSNFADKKTKWLKKSIKQNKQLLLSYDYFFSCETAKNVEKLENDIIFNLFNETKVMQQEITERNIRFKQAVNNILLFPFKIIIAIFIFPIILVKKVIKKVIKKYGK